MNCRAGCWRDDASLYLRNGGGRGEEKATRLRAEWLGIGSRRALGAGGSACDLWRQHGTLGRERHADNEKAWFASPLAFGLVRWHHGSEPRRQHNNRCFVARRRLRAIRERQGCSNDVPRHVAMSRGSALPPGRQHYAWRNCRSG